MSCAKSPTFLVSWRVPRTYSSWGFRLEFIPVAPPFSDTLAEFGYIDFGSIGTAARLQLNPTTGPVELFVIDRVEKAHITPQYCRGLLRRSYPRNYGRSILQ